MRFVSLLTLFILAFILAACDGKHARLDAYLVDAAASGDAVQVGRLLDQGAGIDTHARDDWTPLTISAREGRLNVVQLLLKRGAAVKVMEGGGHTALFWARKYGHSEVENVLLAAGCKDQ
jgi:ankyrin repeat protein